MEVKEATAGAWAGGAPEGVAGTGPLNLSVYTKWPQNPAWAPTDLTVQNLIKDALAEYVGRPVNLTWESGQPGMDALQNLQMREASGQMPDIWGQDDMLNLPDLWTYATRKNLIKETTEEDFKTHMKGWVSRIAYYGASFDNVMLNNLSPDGKHWYIPFAFQSAGFPESDRVPKPFWARVAGGYTGGYFRDDILKQVFPQAKSEAQVRDLLLQKGGDLDVSDVTDIPIKSWSDLYDYGMKVKALVDSRHLTANGQPIIPLAPFYSSEDPMSTYWSLVSAAGAWWHLDWDPGTPLDDRVNARVKASYKEQLRWMNKMYNSGLLDPEIFIMKNDQYLAKVANGQYAEVNAFFNNMLEARRVGKEQGYGWRAVPFFYPTDLSTNANRYQSVLIRSVGLQLGNTDTVNAYWGSPDWYTGTGDARRYRSDYSDLENWTVYGIEGGKDGTYYGLGGGAVGLTYPNSPYYVYRRDAVRGGLFLWPRVFTLENYQYVLSQLSLRRAYVNTILRAAIGSFLCLSVTGLAAYAVSKNDLRGRNLLITYFMIPMFIGGTIVSNYIVIAKIGLINNWLVYVLPGSFNFFFLIIIRTFMNGLPASLEESAQIDGAGYFTILIRIVVPLCMPVVATILLFSAVGYWLDFYTNLLYVTKQSMMVLQYLLSMVVRANRMSVLSQMQALQSGAVAQLTGAATAR